MQYISVAIQLNAALAQLEEFSTRVRHRIKKKLLNMIANIVGFQITLS